MFSSVADFPLVLKVFRDSLYILAYRFSFVNNFFKFLFIFSKPFNSFFVFAVLFLQTYLVSSATACLVYCTNLQMSTSFSKIFLICKKCGKSSVFPHFLHIFFHIFYTFNRIISYLNVIKITLNVFLITNAIYYS